MRFVWNDCVKSISSVCITTSPTPTAIHHGLFAIRRRLGLQRFAELTDTLDREYYDPMYRYQLEKKAANIVFRGTWQDVANWLKAQ